MSTLSVFFLGATGYVGGSVLVDFVKRYPTFTWTALVRNQKDVSPVEAVGPNVKVIIGSFKEIALIEANAKEHDITINLANCDDLDLTQAVIRGQEERAASGGRKPILIHTSGGAVVFGPYKGVFDPNEPIYDDKDVESIKNIPSTAIHRSADNIVFAASEKGLIDAYIICPGTIYGKGLGPVKRISTQLNSLIRLAAQRRQYLQVGPGTNMASGVHVRDLPELFKLVLDLAISGKNTNKSYANFFWGSHGTFTWGEVNKKVAKIMYQKGLIDSSEVGSVSAGENFWYAIAAPNYRFVSNRAYDLGWRPSAPGIDNEEALIEEVELTLGASA